MAVVDATQGDIQDARLRLFRDALRSWEPTWELRGTLRVLLALGHDRAELERDLTRLMLDLRSADREREEDALVYY